MPHIPERPNKDEILRARCSRTLKARLMRMAALTEKDASDLIRDAVMERVMAFEQRLKAA